MELNWKKSSDSPPDGGNCVEVAVHPENADAIAIREGEDPRHVVWTTRAKWTAFVNGVKNGEFDNPVA